MVTAAELEALIQDWGNTPKKSIDTFFPLRFWCLFVICFLYAAWLLFKSNEVAALLSSQPSEVARISKFLYFRGWFLGTVLWLGIYSYLKNWYLPLVLSGMFLVGSINFVFDLFNIYAEVLNNPSPRVTITLLIRLVAISFIFISIKNSGRLPHAKDRMNILLPFKKPVG